MVPHNDHPPIWVDDAKGARFHDVDGNEYVDFNIADMSMFGGYGPEPVVEAVSRRTADGSQFLLPGEDSIWVAEELARRYGLPQWQFTLSATGANLEAIRGPVPRAATPSCSSAGSTTVTSTRGSWSEHGTVVPEEAGLPANVTDNVVMVQFNDVAALRSALETRRIAIVVTEPALTNFTSGSCCPSPGSTRRAMRRDQRDGHPARARRDAYPRGRPRRAHRVWGLEPDLITLGKSIAGGVPIGAYGMTDEIAETLRARLRPGSVMPTVATGGTLFANPLLDGGGQGHARRSAHARGVRAHQELGRRLAEGIEAAIAGTGPLDHPPLLAAIRLHVRPVDAARRRAGWKRSTCRCAT